jgi:hypothetical protein
VEAEAEAEAGDDIMESNGMEWNGMEWNRMEWNRMDSNGKPFQFNEMESNGIEWNRMEWNIISVIFSIVYNGKRRLRKGFTHN